MPVLPRRHLASALLATLVVAAAGPACGDDRDEPAAGGRKTTSTAGGGEEGPGGPGPTVTGTPGGSAADRPPHPDDIPEVALELVGRFEQPVTLVTDPAGVLHVVEKEGRLLAVEGDRRTTVLDLRGEVSTGGEQGLLGVAFHPDGTRLYVNHTDRSGDTRVVEHRRRPDGTADPAGRLILAVDQPYANHNGGRLAMGADGLLWIALGDGGSAGDPQDHAERLDTLLGKLLRIDPTPDGDRPYSIPPSNPFVGRSGARAEIWAYGLRNPWAFSFDRATGDLWIADVGQSRREEIDLERAPLKGGQDYGWDRMEGTTRYEGEAPPGAVPPVFDYDRDEGACSITGGVVYRGSRIPALRGAYLFGDLCVGELRGLGLDGDRWADAPLGADVDRLVAIAEDRDGEVLVASITGEVHRIVPR